jgi:hypothetical protein
VFGKEPNLPIDSVLKFNGGVSETVENRLADLVDHLNVVRNEVKINIDLAKKQRKLAHDKGVTGRNLYKVGGLVWVASPPKLKPGETKKFLPRWAGPYQITKISSPVTVKLKHLETNKVSIWTG